MEEPCAGMDGIHGTAAVATELTIKNSKPEDDVPADEEGLRSVNTEDFEVEPEQDDDLEENSEDEWEEPEI